MKNISDEVYRLTRLMTPIADMATLIGVPEMDLRMLLESPETEEYKLYRKARAEVGVMIRQKNIELAEAGSPTASDAVEYYYKTMLIDL